MNARELINQLELIAKSHGDDIEIEARDAAGDMDCLDSLNSVQIGVNWQGISVVLIDPSAE